MTTKQVVTHALTDFQVAVFPETLSHSNGNVAASPPDQETSRKLSPQILKTK
jgi:hypothetical protein